MIRTTGLMLAAALSLAGCAGASTATTAGTASGTATADAMASPAMSDAKTGDAMSGESMSGDAMMAGAYLTQAQYEQQMSQHAGTKVVYFFHADWCPTCRATDASLTKDGVPQGLTVVKVDYDTATDLRKQYGITQQHTFVQVGSDGAELAKWSGSATGEEIKSKTV